MPASYMGLRRRDREGDAALHPHGGTLMLLARLSSGPRGRYVGAFPISPWRRGPSLEPEILARASPRPA